jgi:hypothetical protein
MIPSPRLSFGSLAGRAELANPRTPIMCGMIAIFWTFVKSDYCAALLIAIGTPTLQGTLPGEIHLCGTPIDEGLPHILTVSKFGGTSRGLLLHA